MKSYCHLCGSKYIEGKSQPWECPDCGNLSYENASPTVDILFFDKQGRALIAERGLEPALGKYDLPGGFVDKGETIEQALKREIFEELGLSENDYTTPVYFKSQTGPYQFSKETTDFLGVIFVSKLKTDREIVGHDDVASVKFVEMDELSNIDFSLDSYPDTIRSAHKKLFKSLD